MLSIQVSVTHITEKLVSLVQQEKKLLLDVLEQVHGLRLDTGRCLKLCRRLPPPRLLCPLDQVRTRNNGNTYFGKYEKYTFAQKIAEII